MDVVDAVPRMRIMLDGVYVAVAAQGVLLIHPPAISPHRIEAWRGISTAADFANPFVPDGEAETFLHTYLLPLRLHKVPIRKITGLALFQKHNAPPPYILLQLE